MTGLEGGWGWRGRDVLDATDSLALELASVELLDSSLQVGGSLIFDKSCAITFTANLRVDDVESRLSSEILEVL